MTYIASWMKLPFQEELEYTAIAYLFVPASLKRYYRNLYQISRWWDFVPGKLTAIFFP